MVWGYPTEKWQLILQDLALGINNILVQQFGHRVPHNVQIALGRHQRRDQRGALWQAAIKHHTNSQLRGVGYVQSAGPRAQEHNMSTAGWSSKGAKEVTSLLQMQPDRPQKEHLHQHAQGRFLWLNLSFFFAWSMTVSCNRALRGCHTISDHSAYYWTYVETIMSLVAFSVRIIIWWWCVCQCGCTLHSAICIASVAKLRCFDLMHLLYEEKV